MVVLMHPPLVVSRDGHLVDEVTRLAAAAGVTPDVRPPGVSALQGWFLAPLVLVGHDAAEELAALDTAATPAGAGALLGGGGGDAPTGRRSPWAPNACSPCRATPRG